MLGLLSLAAKRNMYPRCEISPSHSECPRVNFPTDRVSSKRGQWRDDSTYQMYKPKSRTLLSGSIAGFSIWKQVKTLWTRHSFASCTPDSSCPVQSHKFSRWEQKFLLCLSSVPAHASQSGCAGQTRRTHTLRVWGNTETGLGPP
jgi:hypothetical protein